MPAFDDQGSPQTPFSNEGSGGIFDAPEPDLIWQSASTHERYVDTQSGFLVVVRRVDDRRLSLSLRRRLGTPPQSAILFTPDESLKLSQILGGNWAPERDFGPMSEEVQAFLKSSRKMARKESQNRFHKGLKQALVAALLLSIFALGGLLGYLGNGFVHRGIAGATPLSSLPYDSAG